MSTGPTYGVLQTFDHLTQEWESFKSRLNQWFIANDITSQTDKATVKRRAILLTSLCESSFKLASDLALPKKVEELQYEELVKILDDHFTPKRLGFAEKSAFYAATQRQGESHTQWAARLRGLAAHCEFKNLEEALLDKFIMGMMAGRERDKLFVQNQRELTLAKAIDLAESVRCARQASSQAAPGASSADAASHAVFNINKKEKCSVCGFNNHKSNQCRFKNYKCKKCNTKGHLRKMCPNGEKIKYVDEGTSTVDDGDDERPPRRFTRTYSYPPGATRQQRPPAKPDPVLRESIVAEFHLVEKSKKVKPRKISDLRYLDLSPDKKEVQRSDPTFVLPSLCGSPTSQRGQEKRTPSSTWSQSTQYAHRSDRSVYVEEMHTLEDVDRKIIIEFCHLLEKSRQLFNGLRELPAYGHKQWHAYFAKTFDVYSKLWKFQQQHRIILDTKYGLKRWQIGEIASKIGQLYYHFYLRTSDTGYLKEAFSFYYAIRGRSYYTQASKEDKCELMVKKLRYYARFIVTGLLLKKTNLVSDLLKELDRQIIEYGNAYDPDDQNEWRVVADDVRSFIKVEPVVAVYHPKEYMVVLSNRLHAPLIPPIEKTPAMILTLHEVVVVGNISTQLKFAELTVDMYRIVQTLERECIDVQHMCDESPRQRSASTPSGVNSRGYNLDCGSSKNEGPHKFVLFKPSPNQIFIHLASACDDLPPNGVVLLYISAEGVTVPASKISENGYGVGGLITTSKTDILQRENTSTKDGKPIVRKYKEQLILHPGDLYPFTRRPMCIIVDSDNSFIFNDMPRLFGQPLIILMSPIQLPTHLYPTDNQRVNGSLFTLFLHCPLSAVCFCCDIDKLPLAEWERAQTDIDAFLKEAAIILTRFRESIYLSFMGDEFFRVLILRFIFCETILRMHRMFRGWSMHTRCSPPLPDYIYEYPSLMKIVEELVTHLQVQEHFHDMAGPPP